MRLLSVACVVSAGALSCPALNREAFTFTSYNLHVRIEPEQRRLEVRGRITLRNDSSTPQKNLSLQISSSLGWRAVEHSHQALPFVSQTYTSDIDHTGVLSEAIVELPQAVPPKENVELEVGYEGVIPLDTTRLTRIGVPEEEAKHTDWDQISESFTAVRGVGYVAWYPVAIEAASLSDANSVLEALGRWKEREADAAMTLVLESTRDETLLFSGTPNLGTVVADADIAKVGAFTMLGFGSDVPAFAMADYHQLTAKLNSTIEYLPGQQDSAQAYVNVMAQLDPFSPVGKGAVGTLQVVQLPDPDAAAFSTQGMLFTPLVAPVTKEAELTLIYALTRELVWSRRAWIKEGLAHYAQLQHIEQQQGRQAALDYLNAHRPELAQAEKDAVTKSASDTLTREESEKARSLVHSADNLYAQTKAMYVWWMLRDMVGELNGALLGYRATEDQDPAYLERLIEPLARRDLRWFFEDWVYHDRGLPDFRVASVYPSPTSLGGYMVTVTVENLGSAGAEVPVTVRAQDSEATKRLEVRAKSKNSIRIMIPSQPQEVVVNDGSVPESDMSNNVFQVQPSNVQPSNVQPSNVQPSNVQPSTIQPSTVQPSKIQPAVEPH
jgi:hypothetical protein